MTATVPLLFGLCAAAYCLLSLLIGAQARQLTSWMLAGCCLITAVWALSAALHPGEGLSGASGALDAMRALGWYAFILHLYRRSAGPDGKGAMAFLLVGLAGCALTAGTILMGLPAADERMPLLSLPVLLRLGVAVCQLLMIENLYLNLPRHARWHIVLPCVSLGGLAGMDILLCTDAVMYGQPSTALQGARALAMVMVAPLIAVAAGREQRWRTGLQLSRSAVFHSATLILSGALLLALSAAGEVFRQFGSEWGWLAKISLVFAGIMGLGVVLTSGSGRSRLRRMFVEHLFASRYDYRRQWLDCIDTLSGLTSEGRVALHARAIRALADVVDSPGGVLFLREASSGPFLWAGSWNMPAAGAVPPDHPLVQAMRGGDWIVDMRQSVPEVGNVQPLGQFWLAIPLVHRRTHIGLVLVGSPRAPFRLNQEVFDLLRIVGQEVATYVAEQRATQVMLQTRQLHDYSKRFAFVAHDIKNVSSQLSLLLSNAERHIANPDFQQDMLQTVGASVAKITALLQRLDRPEADRAPSALAPLPRLEELVATYRRVRKQVLELEHDGSTATVAMGADAFDTSVTHLLNNAAEASEGRPVVVRIRHEARHVVIEIVDQGPGMSPEFVRDQLFQPFGTSKPDGSGIGAFQARELLQEGGGELQVITAPGAGTTMRLVLARTDTVPSAVSVPPQNDAKGGRVPANEALVQAGGAG